MERCFFNNKIEKWIPPIITEFTKNLYSYLQFFLYKEKKIIKQNKELRHFKKNKKAYILATGPSMKNLDLSFLIGEDCYSVSNFFLHEKTNEIKPKIHFFAPFHKPLILENYIEWLRTADEKLPENTIICLGHTTKKIVQKNRLFENRKVYYLYLSNVTSMFSSLVNIQFPIKSPQTGPLMIIPTLIYMGYKEIFLVGCDHNILKDYNSNTQNFYGANEDIRKNATDRNSWPDIIQAHLNSINVFSQYRAIKKIADKKNVKIFNLSESSWLDSFEKIKI